MLQQLRVVMVGVKHHNAVTQNVQLFGGSYRFTLHLMVNLGEYEQDTLHLLRLSGKSELRKKQSKSLIKFKILQTKTSAVVPQHFQIGSIVLSEVLPQSHLVDGFSLVKKLSYLLIARYHPRVDELPNCILRVGGESNYELLISLVFGFLLLYAIELQFQEQMRVIRCVLGNLSGKIGVLYRLPFSICSPNTLDEFLNSLKLNILGIWSSLLDEYAFTQISLFLVELDDIL